jgi:hypothetical protein
MKYITLKSVALLLAAVLAVIPLGCKLSHNKVGKLVGISVGVPQNITDASLKYLGTVSVRLDDNTVVDALCDEKLLQTLSARGDHRLEIEPIDGKVKWKVVRALE